MSHSYIYLASPYSDDDPLVRHARYMWVLQVTADMIKNGLVVYSPIVHSHILAQVAHLPTDFKFWGKHSLAMLAHASELHVLKFKGWEDSRGVISEIHFAGKENIPTTYVEHIP